MSPTVLPLLLLPVLARGVQLGETCPDIPPLRPFTESFAGDWYLQRARGTADDVKCKQEFIIFRAAIRIQYFNHALRISDSQPVTDSGETSPLKGARVGDHRYNINGTLLYSRIVATDYVSFAIYLTCRARDLKTLKDIENTYILAIWTREKQASYNTIRHAEEAMRSLNLSMNGLEDIDQKNCPRVERQCREVKRSRSVGTRCDFKVIEEVIEVNEVIDPAR